MPQEFVFVFFEMFLVYLPNKVKEQRICSSKGALLTFMIIGVGNQFPFSCLQSLDLSVFQRSGHSAVQHSLWSCETPIFGSWDLNLGSWDLNHPQPRIQHLPVQAARAEISNYKK